MAIRFSAGKVDHSPEEKIFSIIIINGIQVNRPGSGEARGIQSHLESLLVPHLYCYFGSAAANGQGWLINKTAWVFKVGRSNYS